MERLISLSDNTMPKNLSNHTQITVLIHQVCQQQNITPIHAIESGSRAWGFASPDSDYDVRLIYRHEPDWYLRLYADKDTFEFIQNDLFDVPFDIGGWDVRKALQLLYKSNAVIFEWLNSPIVYHSNKKFLQAVKAVQGEFFDPKAIFYHYQGMAKNANGELELDKPIKLKKWFYLLRALLASIWTIEQACPPPVDFNLMLPLFTDSEKQEILELVIIKQNQDENYRHTLCKSLQDLTVKLWQRCENARFPEKKQGDVALLDTIFRTTISI